MFCSNCGKEMADNQRFCSYCGSENARYTTTAVVERPAAFPVAADGNGGFNRDVLINYIGNLRTLEIVKKDLLTQKNKMEKKISVLGHQVPIKLYQAKLWDCVEDRWDSIQVYGPFVVVPAMIAFILQKYVFTAPSLVMSLIMVLPIILIVYNIIAVFVTYFRKMKKETEKIAWAENKMQRERKEKAELEQKFSALQRELQKVKSLLNKAYSINVIPTKCRNIYGAYFLYDYMTTSAATLSEALFHFDLDEISQRLDRVIQQQQEQILQIARNNALNQQLIMQNEEMIQRAIAIEENTALAAQYAEVAAVNTETMATIQAVHFWYDVSKR